MKQHSNQKSRPRGRSSNNQRKGPSRNQNFDSNGPGVRIRGSAHQVMDKYLTLARDAAGQGDRVLSENYLQHAEHYFRIVQSQQPRTPRIANPAAADGMDGPISEIPAEEQADANNAVDPAQEAQPQRRPPARPRRTRRAPVEAPVDGADHGEGNSASQSEAVVEHTTVTEAPVVAAMNADDEPKETIAV